ncbi:TPA: tail needle knob protein [Citrobacter braakii]
MADDSLAIPVIVRAVSISASSIPAGYSPAYSQYILSQSIDFTSVADKANQAGQGAYQAQVRNDEQDVILSDHEDRITAAETTLADHELRISAAEVTIADHEIRITQNESDISSLNTRVGSLETQVSDHEARIDALEYAVTRKKSEVVYTGLTQVIPTTPTNLVTMLKALTPASGTLAPFFNTTSDKMVVYNENKTLNFKLSMIGSYPGGTANRSMQLTFSGAVPDTLVASRNAATATDNILLATFFSVDQGGFLATNGSTLTIQSNGAVFTATTIKIIAEQ